MIQWVGSWFFFYCFLWLICILITFDNKLIIDLYIYYTNKNWDKIIEMKYNKNKINTKVIKIVFKTRIVGESWKLYRKIIL